jgi:hypothetical protein
VPTGPLCGVHRNTSADQVDALLCARLGQPIRVEVLRLEADTGHIYVSEQVSAGDLPTRGVIPTGCASEFVAIGGGKADSVT